jgi:hypothetical protein
MRTISNIRTELATVQAAFLQLYTESPLAAEFLSGDYIDKMKDLESRLNFLTTRSTKLKLYHRTRNFFKRLTR